MTPEIIILIVVVAVIASRISSRRHDCNARREGLGLGRIILLVIIGLFVARLWSASKERSASEWAQQSRQQAEHDRREVERAHRHTTVAARQAPLEVQTSIEQLWDKLNQPKIDLHASDQINDMTVKTGSTTVEMHAAPVGARMTVAPASSESHGTADSFARSAAEIGRLFADVSAIAQHVSDGTRLVARTLLAAEQPAERELAAAPPAPAAQSTSIIDRGTTAPPKDRVKAATVAESKKHAASSAELNEKIGGDLPSNKPRPAWVDEQQKQVGNVLRQVVVAGPYATAEECYAKTNELLKIATDNYVKHYLAGLGDDRPLITAQEGSPLVKINNFTSKALEGMGIGVGDIRREIAKDEYLESVATSVGPMKNLHTLLEFSPDVDRDLQVRWNEFLREGRLTAIGLLSGSVLGVIGLAFGLLKVDTVTRGYYSKRLFLGVPAAIIGVITLVALFAH
jgi:hypothetical protein